MSIYTDLACEAREFDPALNGVTEERVSKGEIEIIRTKISDEAAAQRLNKRVGRYVTLDAPGLILRPLDLFGKVTKVLSEELISMIGSFNAVSSVLIVGLGNRSVTPDSLGPRTAERIFVTRHVKEYMPEAFDFPVVSVASVSPGVLGSTGIETSELISGVVDRIKPDFIIAVDSLASRRASRIGATIQLSDAGIDPGSGVGNIRTGLNRDTLGIPVIAVGVPLVVHASTIMHDAITALADETGQSIDVNKLNTAAERAASERMDGLIVTPKDIDAMIEDMSGIISEGINRALFGARYDDVKMLIA